MSPILNNQPNPKPNDVRVLGSGAAVDERRSADRLFMNVAIDIAVSGESIDNCATDNLSEGGLFVSTPDHAGLSVGQRCEVRFRDDPQSPIWSSLGGQTCFATVVRTTAVADSSTKGAGLRFDQPLYL